MYAYNLSKLFTKILSECPTNIAIKFSDKKYTYLELDQVSNLLATKLLDDGIKRGDVIAIINSKEFLAYALMLACLKIGVIYTNVDPQSPPIRFESIIKQCQPWKIFSDHEPHAQLSQVSQKFSLKIEILNDLYLSTKNVTPREININVDGDTIAYIMFTSGSTGHPKGVAISHQNLLHFIHWSLARYQITKKDVIANVNPMYFDNSVFDFYTAIFSGACLVPINHHITSQPKKLVSYIDDMQCTVWFSVPSLLIYLMTMRVLQKNNFKAIRVITFGGEGYPKIELKKLYDMYKDRIRFINVYGPTECTCICSSYELTDKDFDDIEGLPPLGQINPNFSFLVQNDDGSPDVQGELCLFGPNVGRGYYNNNAATKRVFCEFTGHGFYQSRMYRTGDIVHYENGILYFIGRKDNQVKHMGYRIELEEIEAAINLIPEVTQAAVLYQKIKSTYGKIIAYISSTEIIDVKYIHEKLKPILPAYMLPNKIVVMEHLPKNQNGKIDKQAILDLILAETT